MKGSRGMAMHVLIKTFGKSDRTGMPAEKRKLLITSGGGRLDPSPTRRPDGTGHIPRLAE